MFGVNHNADIRYPEYCEEMLLAIDEICDLWTSQKQPVMVGNEKKQIHFCSIFHLQREWARKLKYLIQPLRSVLQISKQSEGQIKAHEAL